MSKTKNERFWEIDFLRGIAIIMMIIYHILFDIYFFGVVKINLHSMPFRLFLYPIGTTFLLLVGVSLIISYSRVKNTLSEKEIWLKFIKRGILIFGLGLILTVVTFFYLGSGFIIFGVLHCIGLCIILSIPFLKYRFVNLLLGIILVFIGIVLRTMTFDFSYLLWVGFVPRGFYTIDYFPLLPWLGVVLIGIFIGNTLYIGHKRSFHIPDLSSFKLSKFFCFLGRNSLAIYFLHQPIILGLIYVFLLS